MRQGFYCDTFCGRCVVGGEGIEIGEVRSGKQA